MQLLIATSNPGKIKEISEVLENMDLEIFTLKDLNVTADVEETGSTYAENAEIKARFFFQEIDGEMPVLSDDSGVVIEALLDELGVYTRRWGAGSEATDQEWVDYFLNRMQEFKSKKLRKAKFISNFCYFDGIHPAKHFLGECQGTITKKLEAEVQAGVPLSSCFLPEGQDKVFSALSSKEKEKISHRGRAAAKFKEYLKSLRHE